MNFRYILVGLGLVVWASTVAAQTPELDYSESMSTRGANFEDVESIELSNALGSPKTKSIDKCNYFELEDGSFIGHCATTEYTGGSVEVPKWSVPYQVQILTNPKGESDELLQRSFPSLELWQARHICSGSLIDENWILTAAHCIDKNIKPQGYGVRLKADSISENLDDYIEAESYFIHPDYQARPLENDVALIKLSEQGPPRKFEEYNPGVGTGKMAYWQAYFSVDGKRVITRPPPNGTADHFAVWDSTTGRKIYSHIKIDDIHRSLEFDRETGMVFGIDAAGAWVFDMQTDSHVRRISGTDSTHRITFLKNIDHLATWTRDDIVTFWDRSNLRKIPGFTADVPVSGLRQVKKGMYVLYDEQGVERVFDVETGVSRLTGHGMNYRLSPNGESFVEIQDQTLFLRRTSDGQILKSSPVRDRSWAAWPAGDYFAVEDSDIRIVDTNTLEDKLRLPRNKYQLLKVSGEKVMAMSRDNDFTVFKLGSQRPIGKARVPEDYRDAGRWTLLDKDRKLLMWLPGGKSKVWRLKDGKLLYEINHSLPISRVELSDDQKYIISSSEFGPTDIWSARDGSPVNRIFHRGVQGVSYSAATEQVLTWDNRGIARMWALDSKKNTAEIDIRPLSTGATFLYEIAKIALAKKEPEDGTQLWAYGWGKTREVAALEPVSVLRGIAFPKISDETCREKFKSARLELGEDEICAFDEARKTCKGDSGGPITSDTALVGVTSWGARSCSDDKKQPSVMANVAYFRPWIKEIACSDEHAASSRPRFCDN